MTNVPPSRDPANDDSLTGLIKEIRRWILKNLDKALPAVVLRHDRTNNSVRVRPIISKVDSNGKPLKRSEVASVPVLNLGGGGFFINFHLPAGQQGMIMTFDRDISLFLQSKRESQPNTERMHEFDDSIFIPQQWFDYIIDEEDAEAMVIQNLDGSVKIALDQNSIRIVKGATRVEIDETKFNVTTTDFNVDSATFTHNGQNVGDTHIHGGVTPGGGTTGNPV